MQDPGITRELLQEAAHLARNAPSSSVKLRIPKSHPQAPAFMELVRILADEVRLESGLTVKRTPIPGAEAALLDALRRLGAPVDEMLGRLGVGADRHAEMLRAGLGILSAFGAMVGGPTVDLTKRLEDRLGPQL